MEAKHPEMYKALYQISYWRPRQEMNGGSFAIKLFPALKEAIAEAGLTCGHAEYWLESHGPFILEGHGYRRDSHGMRIGWGEWGLEHVDVPGNACGLDIEMHGIGGPPGGAILQPHNVDTVRQASMLLAIFSGIYEILILNQEIKANGRQVEPLLPCRRETA